MINITLPDNTVRQYPEGTNSLEIAKSISEGLARNVLSATVNGEIWDATRPIYQDAHLKLNTWDSDEGKFTMWHSSAHLMAEAVEQLYPGVKFGIGPAIENGFYYDMDFGDRQILAEDLKSIEDKMLELAREKQTYNRKEVSKDQAL
ncbi:MAG: TGS domain-containing protein, partial [Omnitrophica WOR_2 bacterium]